MTLQHAQSAIVYNTMLMASFMVAR